jgi:hypothetical protein
MTSIDAAYESVFSVQDEAFEELKSINDRLVVAINGGDEPMICELRRAFSEIEGVLSRASSLVKELKIVDAA